MPKNKEIRFAPTDDERAALEALVSECGFNPNQYPKPKNKPPQSSERSD